MKSISSRQNPIVREFRALADAPDPTGTRLLLDGVHLVRDAHAARLPLEIVAVAASRLESPTEEGELARALERDGVTVIEVADTVFPAVSPVKTPGGIAAIATRAAVAATDICRGTGFLVAAVDVQDPGNLGSIVRAAEAGGVTGMFVAGASANPFSWKALRGSMGSALRLPIVDGMQPTSVLTCMKKSGLRAIAAIARGGTDPDAIDWRGNVGLLVGGEGPGLSDDLIASCDERTTIPMAEGVESLNVAVSAGILVYAARRQRRS